MRELIAAEVMSVVGAGSVECEMVSGYLECDGDSASGTFDDMWLYGDDGSWAHVVDGNIVASGDGPGTR